MDDCNPVMDKLKAVNMLVVPQMGFPAWPGERTAQIRIRAGSRWMVHRAIRENAAGAWSASRRA